MYNFKSQITLQYMSIQTTKTQNEYPLHKKLQNKYTVENYIHNKVAFIKPKSTMMGYVTLH